LFIDTEGTEQENLWITSYESLSKSE
jgi:hypothetical protein